MIPERRNTIGPTAITNGQRNMSPVEEEAFIEIMLRYPYIIDNKNLSRTQAMEIWEKIRNDFRFRTNSDRSIETLKNKWQKVRQAAKKRIGYRYKLEHGENLTAFEDRILKSKLYMSVASKMGLERKPAAKQTTTQTAVASTSHAIPMIHRSLDAGSAQPANNPQDVQPPTNKPLNDLLMEIKIKEATINLEQAKYAAEREKAQMELAKIELEFKSQQAKYAKDREKYQMECAKLEMERAKENGRSRHSYGQSNGIRR